MNLRHLEVFRHVMQTGTVKGAAAAMHISEAAASKLLATAQRRLGLSLFERVQGRLLPTPQARRLYEDVEQLWVRVKRIEDLTHSMVHRSSGGTLALAASPGFGITVLPQAATALLQSLPTLTLNVDLLIPHLLIQAIVEGAADIGVTLSPRNHPSLQLLDRYPCPLVCVMPQAHPLAARREIRPADLVGYPVVSFPQALDYGVGDEVLYGRHGDAVSRRIHLRSAQTACWFSLAGAGPAIVDAATVAGRAFPGLVVRPYRCKARLAVHVLRNRNRPLSQAGGEFRTAFAQTWRRLFSAAS